VQSQFRLEVRSEGHATVIVVRGELDLASGPELEAELGRLPEPPPELLVVDLRHLDFMDSTGLSILVKAHQRAVEEGREFGLVRGTPQVQRLLELTGVSERLPMADSPEELLDGG
jgi:stage II sporulation protein AA (anti-sigma F factor antagonist)